MLSRYDVYAQPEALQLVYERANDHAARYVADIVPKLVAVVLCPRSAPLIRFAARCWIYYPGIHKVLDFLPWESQGAGSSSLGFTRC